MELTEKEVARNKTLPLDPENFKGFNPYRVCCDFKKCCEKYKKGKRCKKCPGKQTPYR